MATVIQRSGSAPQVVGARLLLDERGVLVGTVGGGAIEAQVLAACRASLADGQPRRISSHLARDLGMCCGGAMEVFVERVQGAPRLLLLGAGRVALAVSGLARAVGFRVFVIGDIEPSRVVGCATIRWTSRRAEELAAVLPAGHADDFVLIATGDHRADGRALAVALERPHHLIGMIGSRSKIREVLSQLADERGRARAPVSLARVRAPVGLALGGQTPGEIAVSIVAEFIKERRGGDGARMNVVPAAVAQAARA
jgi:xanthine dehydrogenase accessory factor